MDCRASIEVNTRVLPMNRRCYEFKWVGSKNSLALVDTDAWEKLKKEFPWPLKVMVEPGITPYYIVVRTDGTGRLSWAYYTAKAWLKNRTARVKARLIMTAVIWDLAWVPEGEIPGWRHLGKKRGW